MPSSARRNPWHGRFVAYAGSQGLISASGSAGIRLHGCGREALMIGGCGVRARVTVVGMARFADVAA